MKIFSSISKVSCGGGASSLDADCCIDRRTRGPEFWLAEAIPLDWGKERSMASKDLPFVSGIHNARTTTVNDDKDPNRKYAPYAERARKIGVAKATSQLVNCLRSSALFLGYTIDVEILRLYSRSSGLEQRCWPLL